MPYLVKKVGQKYRLWNLKKKEFVNKVFNTKESAISTGINYMKYRKENPLVIGNKIINNIK